MTSFFLLSLFMALIFKLNASPFGIYFDVRSDIGVQLLFGFEGNLFGLLDAQVSPNWGGGGPQQEAGGEFAVPGGAGATAGWGFSPQGLLKPRVARPLAPGETGASLGCISELNTETLSS